MHSEELKLSSETALCVCRGEWMNKVSLWKNSFLISKKALKLLCRSSKLQRTSPIPCRANLNQIWQVAFRCTMLTARLTSCAVLQIQASFEQRGYSQAGFACCYALCVSPLPTMSWMVTRLLERDIWFHAAVKFPLFRSAGFIYCVHSSPTTHCTMFHLLSARS